MSAWLFCPGHDSKKVEGALKSNANVVVIDWEDAVPDSAKERARQTTYEILARSRGAAPRVVVRVNAAASHEFVRDVTFLQSLSVGAVMLPKSERVDDVRQLCALGVRVVALIETALGVEKAGALADADARVERLAFGSLDFLADVGGRWSSSGHSISYARQRIVLSGRVNGREAPLDGVWPLLGDIEGLKLDARVARDMGYGGKLVVHPEQIGPVQKSFAPSEEEVTQARRIVEGYRMALAVGKTALQLDGQFIDPPVVKRAEQMLKLAGQEDDAVDGNLP